MIRRINFFGGPGVGKSTLAAKLFSDLKALHFPVELVDEVIKSMAWRGLHPEGYDSLKIFSKQLCREDEILRSGGTVITAGPLFQQLIYMKRKNVLWTMPLIEIAELFEDDYPSLNFYIHRNVPFRTEGRYQKNIEEAQVIDQATEDFLFSSPHLNVQGFSPNDYDNIYDAVIIQLPSPPNVTESLS